MGGQRAGTQSQEDVTSQVCAKGQTGTWSGKSTLPHAEQTGWGKEAAQWAVGAPATPSAAGPAGQTLADYDWGLVGRVTSRWSLQTHGGGGLQMHRELLLGQALSWGLCV